MGSATFTWTVFPRLIETPRRARMWAISTPSSRSPAMRATTRRVQTPHLRSSIMTRPLSRIGLTVWRAEGSVSVSRWSGLRIFRVCTAIGHSLEHGRCFLENYRFFSSGASCFCCRGASCFCSRGPAWCACSCGPAWCDCSCGPAWCDCSCGPARCCAFGALGATCAAVRTPAGWFVLLSGRATAVIAGRPWLTDTQFSWVAAAIRWCSTCTLVANIRCSCRTASCSCVGREMTPPRPPL